MGFSPGGGDVRRDPNPLGDGPSLTFTVPGMGPVCEWLLNGGGCGLLLVGAVAAPVLAVVSMLGAACGWW